MVAAEQGGVTAALVPVDAPLVALGDIVRGTWPLEFGQRSGTIFSYVMDNYWDTNYAAGQGGDFTFRYVFASGNNLDPGYLSRLGREEMSPLEIDQITSQDKAINSPRPLDAFQASFRSRPLPVVEPRGTTPSEGASEIASACSGVLTVLSRFSRTKASPKPASNPKTSPIPMLRRMLGDTGAVGTQAESTIRILLDLRPTETPASFIFCNSPS